MKAWIVHYKNKFPNCNVSATENSLDVYSADGEHLVSLQKNGAGQWVDKSEELGCKAAHCTAPIPREARVHKLCKTTGKVVLDEEAGNRVKSRLAVMNSAGVVESIGELEKRGFKFDDKGNMVSEPQKKAVAAPQFVDPE